MIDWLSSQKRQEKRKAARDAKLREELAVKARVFENGLEQEQEQEQEQEDFTEITINGRRERIPVNRITIMNVES